MTLYELYLDDLKTQLPTAISIAQEESLGQPSRQLEFTRWLTRKREEAKKTVHPKIAANREVKPRVFEDKFYSEAELVLAALELGLGDEETLCFLEDVAGYF